MENRIPSGSKAGKYGYTLIELIIVMAIITVLQIGRAHV